MQRGSQEKRECSRLFLSQNARKAKLRHRPDINEMIEYSQYKPECSIAMDRQ